MPPKEVEKLMRELSDWCKAEYGRQRQLAVAIGFSEQVLSNWLTGKRVPTFANGLKLIAFLEEQRKASQSLPHAKQKQPKPKGQRQLKAPSQKANSSLAPPQQARGATKGVVNRAHQDPSPDHSV